MALTFPPSGTVYPVPPLADGTQWGWDGTKWIRPSGPGVTIGTTAPNDPVVNQLWLDTNTVTVSGVAHQLNVLKIWNGSAWVTINPPNPLVNWTLTNVNLQGDTSGLPPPPGAIGEFRSNSVIRDIWWTNVYEGDPEVSLTLPAGEWLISGMATIFFTGVMDGTCMIARWRGDFEPLEPYGPEHIPWCGIENANECARMSFSLTTTRARGTTSFNIGIHTVLWRWNAAGRFSCWTYIMAQRFR